MFLHSFFDRSSRTEKSRVWAVQIRPGTTLRPQTPPGKLLGLLRFISSLESGVAIKRRSTTRRRLG